MYCEIRSCHEMKLRSTSTLYVYITNTKRGATPEMVATLPFVDMQVPVMALFRLLGINTRKEVMELIVGDGDDEESRLLAAFWTMIRLQTWMPKAFRLDWQRGYKGEHQRTASKILGSHS